ncbi:MAG TPA: hypothetical protein VIB48_20035 [Acidimicrobiia bacterium]
MAAKTIYRNESLIQVDRYQTDEARAEALVEGLRNKWVYLRGENHAGDYPVEILRTARKNSNGSNSVEVVEVFKWKSIEDREYAKGTEQYQAVLEDLAALTTNETSSGIFTESVRGFSPNFPDQGGMELLRGVCSCLLTIDGYVEDYPMSVKNGSVLMHRSPGMDFDGDGHREMHLAILYHGGDIVEASLGPIRVAQNFNVPNDGIVRSRNIGSNDFPATAIWRVGWAIQTELGRIITDPDTPLVFGPAEVKHYPPVGTEFHSTTGPVKLFMESTGKKVGTLTPGQLTAFDIIVTRDDEVYADHLNQPSEGILTLLKERTEALATA